MDGCKKKRSIYSVSEKAHKSHCRERESYIWIYNSRNQQFIVVQAKEKVGTELNMMNVC